MTDDFDFNLFENYAYSGMLRGKKRNGTFQVYFILDNYNPCPICGTNCTGEWAFWVKIDGKRVGIRLHGVSVDEEHAKDVGMGLKKNKLLWDDWYIKGFQDFTVAIDGRRYDLNDLIDILDHWKVDEPFSDKAKNAVECFVKFCKDHGKSGFYATDD